MAGSKLSRCPYEVLGVGVDASTKEVVSSFRKASLKLHPDKGGDAAQFIELAEAREFLEDESLRSQYDSLVQSGQDSLQALDQVLGRDCRLTSPGNHSASYDEAGFSWENFFTRHETRGHYHDDWAERFYEECRRQKREQKRRKEEEEEKRKQLKKDAHEQFVRNEEQKAANKRFEQRKREEKKKQKQAHQQRVQEQEKADKLAKTLVREQERLMQEVSLKESDEKTCQKEVGKLARTLREINELRQEKKQHTEQQRQKMKRGKQIELDLEKREKELETIQKDLLKLKLELQGVNESAAS
eukprot:TRINITY_DN47578_c0_g1_i1.p1 TRINITY_DN47578_c0_g1~~TRINITY_DN47578_c0_g1_i1.p1  ORF type:complete len:300 (+),score=79.50 TRINITY_DN47578_c0_g1_i1:120-1019(+)